MIRKVAHILFLRFCLILNFELTSTFSFFVLDFLESSLSMVIVARSYQCLMEALCSTFVSSSGCCSFWNFYFWDYFIFLLILKSFDFNCTLLPYRYQFRQFHIRLRPFLYARYCELGRLVFDSWFLLLGQRVICYGLSLPTIILNVISVEVLDSFLAHFVILFYQSDIKSDSFVTFATFKGFS